MSKGASAMSAIAVLVTGGYFAYDYWSSRKAKSPAASTTAKAGSQGSGSGSTPDPERAERDAHRAANPGSGSGSEAGSGEGSEAGSGEGTGATAVHKVQRLKVPKVIGLKPDDAKAKLVALGFKEDVLEFPLDLGCHYEDEKGDIVPVGTICNQERDPDEMLMSNAKLRVVIERDTYEHGGVEADNEWHRMPDLEGMELGAAKALLRSKGFGDDEFVIGEARTSCGRGKVCEQRPKADGRKYVREPGELNLGN